jgi:hypothetical protein
MALEHVALPIADVESGQPIRAAASKDHARRCGASEPEAGRLDQGCARA